MAAACSSAAAAAVLPDGQPVSTDPQHKGFIQLANLRQFDALFLVYRLSRTAWQLHPC
jgi:hypothetical protein